MRGQSRYSEEEEPRGRREKLDISLKVTPGDARAQLLTLQEYLVHDADVVVSTSIPRHQSN